jgi:protein-disulfide isomerase
MAKRAGRSRRTRVVKERRTNWMLIGGIVAIGVLGLFALLIVTIVNNDSPTPTSTPVPGQPLAEYCEENPDRCMTNGNEDAPVTIVEVSDYACRHCRNFNLETSGLLEDLYVTPGQVKWVVLPFNLWPETVEAPATAMCAAEQDAFFSYHKQLFSQQEDPDFLSRENYQKAAESVGIDVETFDACLDSNDYGRIVALNREAAVAVGADTTPTFFINGKMLVGNQPLTNFQQEINAIIGGG